MGDVITNTPINVELKDFFKAFYQNDKKTIYFRTYNERVKENTGSKKEVELKFLSGIISTLQTENRRTKEWGAPKWTMLE